MYQHDRIGYKWNNIAQRRKINQRKWKSKKWDENSEKHKSTFGWDEPRIKRTRARFKKNKNH